MEASTSSIPADVSVIIPTFNRAHLLCRAMESVMVQNHSPKEIIVVDDGSTDETAALIRKNYSNVIYLYQTNSGVSAARNSGIRKASSTWIAFLDSDDEWLPNKLACQLEVLKEHPDMKICHTNEIWIRKGRRVNPKKKHAKSGGLIFQKCLPLCCISPSSVMIHHTVFDTVGLFDETLPVCEDYDFWLRVTSRFPVLYIDEPLIMKYGGHKDQLSRKFWGMDRFRIQALQNIVTSGILSEDDRIAAQAILREKLAIYMQGAQKRGKWEEVDAYEKLLETRGKLNFVVALPAEAKPIIQHFNLKSENDLSPYKTYRSHDNNIWLVISGVGRNATAAATTFLASKSKAGEQTAWLNVGIGGQRDLPVGTPVLANTIIDDNTKKSWHPTAIFKPACKTASVRTVERPVDEYTTDDIYEMEAASFYAAAIQFSNPVMVHVLKVISDNHSSQVEQISRARVIQLIKDRLVVIDQTVDSLRRLQLSLGDLWQTAVFQKEA